VFGFRLEYICIKLPSQLILPNIDYCDVLYQNAFNLDLVPFNTLNNRRCRFAETSVSHISLYNALKSVDMHGLHGRPGASCHTCYLSFQVRFTFKPVSVSTQCLKYVSQ